MTSKLLRPLLAVLLLLFALSGVCGAENRVLTFNSRDIGSWMVISQEEWLSAWKNISCMDVQNITTTEQNGQTYLDCQIMQVSIPMNAPSIWLPDSKWHVLLDAAKSRAFILEKYIGTGPNTLELEKSKDISLVSNAENWTTDWAVGKAALEYLRANRPDLIPSGGAGNASISMPSGVTSGRTLNGYPEALRIEDLLK